MATASAVRPGLWSRLASGQFLRFLSLTSATQLVLLANQLVLLPLQLRIWGNDATAQWFVVLAVANLATVADLGLRNAGHADLVEGRRGDRRAAEAFAGIWALARLLFVIATAALIVWEIRSGAGHDAGLTPWIAAVIVALALDAFIIVRGVWLDTLGHFNRVEAIFLAMVTARVALSVVALLAFEAGPSVLGWIMLATAAAGLALQVRLIGEPDALGVIGSGFAKIRFRALRLIPWVVAEPASNWTRLMLPVVIFASFAAPAVVTTYVGLRAVFGLSRQVVNQVSRFTSVKVVQMRDEAPARAAAITLYSILGCTAFSVAVSALVVADRGRILGLWLKGSDPALIGAIAASLAAGSVGYGYQVIVGVMIRSGKVAAVAVRQYAYLAATAAAALVGWTARSLEVYLVLLALVEISIAATYVAAMDWRVRGGAVAAFVSGAGCLALLNWAASADLGGVFGVWTLEAAIWSVLAAGTAAATGAAACAAIAAALTPRGA